MPARLARPVYVIGIGMHPFNNDGLPSATMADVAGMTALADAGLGFGEGGSWLPQPPEFARLAVAEQTGVEGSVLELYRTALALRRKHFTADEHFEWLDLGDDVLAFRRGSGTVCVVNFGTEPAELPDGEVLVASTTLDAEGRLPTDAAAWVR